MEINYTTLSNIPYVHPVHLGILKIPNNDTHVASYELKRVYNKNIGVLHKVRGVEQALIQHIVTAVKE